MQTIIPEFGSHLSHPLSSVMHSHIVELFGRYVIAIVTKGKARAHAHGLQRVAEVLTRRRTRTGADVVKHRFGGGHWA